MCGHELEKLGWNVREGQNEIWDDILNSAKSLAGQDPTGTVVVLVSKDNSLADLVEALKRWGGQVYGLYNQTFNNRLLETAGEKFGIQWAPLMLEAPKRGTAAAV
jgi:hypothetical protein